MLPMLTNMDGKYPIIQVYKFIIIYDRYIYIQYLILNMDMDFIHINMGIHGYLFFII